MKRTKNKAVALRYSSHGAPKVTAKGEGLLAKQIIAKAYEHGIPLQQNEELTALLSQVTISEEIPAELYTAVAQLLAFIYHLQGKKPGDARNSSNDKANGNK